MEPKEFYSSRIVQLTAQKKKLQQRKSVFAVLRLGSIIAVIAIFYFLWSINKFYAIAAAILTVAVFIKLIYRDLANRAAIKHLQQLLVINENELLALDGKYDHFEDGHIYTTQDHFYANDMDVFGNASLYQFINRTTSEPAAQKLADWLLYPADVDNILYRQESTKELVNKNEWRQNIQAIGKESSVKKSTVAQINNWLTQPTLFIQFKLWQWLRIILPGIILTITALYIFDVIPEKTWYLFLFIYAVIAFQINKIVAPLHNQLSSMVSDLKILSKSIAAIESQPFESKLLS